MNGGNYSITMRENPFIKAAERFADFSNEDSRLCGQKEKQLLLSANGQFRAISRQSLIELFRFLIHAKHRRRSSVPNWYFEVLSVRQFR